MDFKLTRGLALLPLVAMGCGSAASSTNENASTLCGELCAKTTPCQTDGSISFCTDYCESNAKPDLALGCGTQLNALHRCMIDNVTCKNGDVDFVHFIDTCGSQSMALDQCDGRTDAGSSD